MMKYDIVITDAENLYELDLDSSLIRFNDVSSDKLEVLVKLAAENKLLIAAFPYLEE